jgi:hypothetical protein
MTISEKFHKTVERFIELYGDRTESAGTEVQAGFAWINQAKWVAVAGEGRILKQPASLRRLTRMLDIAQQFRRPVLLWDLPFEVKPNELAANLLYRSAVQKAELRLFNFPLPLVAVFDEPAQSLSQLDFALADAAVWVKKPDEKLLSLAEELAVVMRAANTVNQIKAAIAALLDEVSAIPDEIRATYRANRIQKIIKAAISENPDRILGDIPDLPKSK